MKKIVFYLATVSLILFSSGCENQPSATISVFPKLPAPGLKRMSQEQFGIDVNSMKVVQSNFERNQFLTDVLLEHNVAPDVIDEVAKKSESVFDVRRMRAGNSFTILKNGAHKVNYFIYEKTPADYVVFDLRDSVQIYEGRKRVNIQEKTISGAIHSSLFETIQENGLDARLGKLLEEVYAWSVDFFHLEKGDYFKVIYEEEFVDGESIGIGRIVASVFHHQGHDYFAISYAQNGEVEYFDEEGRSLRKELLKAPIKYSRLSARYSKNQPETDQNKDKEVDYAAPAGTPVYAVGNGEVIRAKFRKGLGNHIRIKHGIYTTQYSHLSKIAAGIREGNEIRQGDIIGYVGNSGDAANPRISFRVWENGKVVNPAALSLPSVEVVSAENMDNFQSITVKMLKKLEGVKVKSGSQILVMRD
ncbi:MAG: peptidoglycan DD-metalloendopeptidase family protein [Bacteroidia bacterium]|nr:peptidoglycan DD-metalloendopeptidase family protein [Bacteroidia bacterium]